MHKNTHLVTTGLFEATPHGPAGAGTMALRRTLIALLAALAVLAGIVTAATVSGEAGGNDGTAGVSSSDALPDDVAYRGIFGATWS